MAKYRGQISMAIVTKPLVVEAASFTEAEELFRNIDTSVLLENADSLGVVRHGEIVRVPDSVTTNIATKPKEEKPQSQNELLEAVRKNNENFEQLLKALGPKKEGA